MGIRQIDRGYSYQWLLVMVAKCIPQDQQQEASCAAEQEQERTIALMSCLCASQRHLVGHSGKQNAGLDKVLLF